MNNFKLYLSWYYDGELIGQEGIENLKHKVDLDRFDYKLEKLMIVRNEIYSRSGPYFVDLYFEEDNLTKD